MRTIYYNGKVYTGELPLAEAFMVEEGRFVFTGSSEEALQKKQPGDSAIDLKGAFVSSGFNDSHMHLVNFGASLQSAQLAAHSDSLKGLLDYMKAFATNHPVSEGRWLTGRGWNQDYFTDLDRMPDRYDLDSISTDYPVSLTRCCGHCLVVNSKALELLGITADTAQPEGGRIGLQNGKPDGRFFDNAMSLVLDKIPLPTKEEVKTMILAACKALNRYGITSSQTDDYLAFHGLSWKTIMEAYQELEQEGKLTVRVNEQSNFTSLEDLIAFTGTGQKTGVGSSLFKTGPLKMLGDGSLGARTAYLSRPYADDPSTQGFPVFSQETLDEMIGYANSIGMQVAIHAIGDGCLDMVLNAIEKALQKNPREDHRHGIIHCQITRQDQLDRIARLKLHVYCQSIFLDYDNHIVESRVGKELANTSYSWKTLMEMGVSVSNGTDCPVELPDELKSMECAITRTTVKDQVGPYLPGQAFTVKEALDSYTIRGAEASFEEKEKGLIAPGYLADFVILENDPFEVQPDKIHSIEILATYLEGKCVYQKESPVTFDPLDPSDETAIEEMSAMASHIVKEHYDPLLGSEQNDYMIDMFQSVKAIHGQLAHGYHYYFVRKDGKNLGFLAFYPREDALYLSKLYLYKEERHKGYSHAMLNFVMDRARNEGLQGVELNVNKYNESVFIYEALGMRRIRSEKNDIGSGYYMDDYVYRIDV